MREMFKIASSKMLRVSSALRLKRVICLCDIPINDLELSIVLCSCYVPFV
jgi:hypothetical protein